MSIRKGCPLTVFCLLLLILLKGCYPATPANISGQYVARADWGESVLELRSNGTFVEEARLKNGNKQRTEGTWEYRFENKVAKILRKPCMRIDHLLIEKKDLDYCSQGVDHYITGNIEITVDPDFGFAYVKQ